MKIRMPLARKTPMARGAGPRPKSPMRRKSRVRKTPATKSARGQDCTLQFPGCRNETDTVVLCHLRMFGGGGVGVKPDDCEAVLGCSWCHDRLDGRVPWLNKPVDFWEYIARALVRTHRVLRAAGVLIFKGEQ